jgi:hypothetical protein
MLTTHGETAKPPSTGMLPGSMPCSRSVRGCAGCSRREINALVAPPTIPS